MKACKSLNVEYKGNNADLSPQQRDGFGDYTYTGVMENEAPIYFKLINNKINEKYKLFKPTLNSQWKGAVIAISRKYEVMTRTHWE